jgi:hypothetical protein
MPTTTPNQTSLNIRCIYANKRPISSVGTFCKGKTCLWDNQTGKCCVIGSRCESDFPFFPSTESYFAVKPLKVNNRFAFILTRNFVLVIATTIFLCHHSFEYYWVVIFSRLFTHVPFSSPWGDGWEIFLNCHRGDNLSYWPLWKRSENPKGIAKKSYISPQCFSLCNIGFMLLCSRRGRIIKHHMNWELFVDDINRRIAIVWRFTIYRFPCFRHL